MKTESEHKEMQVELENYKKRVNTLERNLKELSDKNDIIDTDDTRK